MNIRRLAALAAAVSLVCCTAFAAVPVKTFYWTGAAGTGSWSTPGNWKLNNVACTDDYPHQVGDDAYFQVSADVTVDTGSEIAVTRVSAQTSGIVVRIYGTTGSKIAFTTNAGNSYSGLNAQPGASIYLYAEARCVSRYDPSAWGNVHYCGKFTHDSAGYENFNGGTNYNYVSGCDFYTTKSMDYAWGLAAGKTVYINILGDAKIDASQAYNFTLAEGSGNASVVQDGADTVVKAKYFYVGDRGGSYTPWAASTYLLRSGKLQSTDFCLGRNRGATFTQEGGTNTMTYLQIGGGTMCKYPCVYNLKGGLLDVYRFYLGTNESGLYEINHSGGTFRLTAQNAAYDKPVVRFNYSGTPTFEIGGGANCPFNMHLAPTFAPGTVFTKTGNSDLKLFAPTEASDCTWVVTNGSIAAYADGVPVPGGLKPLKIRVTHDGKFQMGYLNGSYGRLATVFSPLDLEIEGNGKFGFNANERYGMYVRSITTNGVKLAKGVYGWNAKAITFNTDQYAAILVPYVWTGKGDGRSWSDANNWEDNVVPPSANDTPVDLSAATVVDLPDSDVTIRGINYSPAKADGVLRINGEKKLTLYGKSYDFSSQVRPGCKVEFNVKSLDVKYDAMLGGGGTFAVVRSDPSGIPVNAELCGTVLYDGVTYANPSSTLRYQGLLGDASCTVVFDGGSDITLGTVSMGQNKTYSDCALIEHRNAKVTLDNLYIGRATGGAINPQYQLKDGELTVKTVLGLGHSNVGATFAYQYFKMTGGKLTAKKMTSSNAESYFYLYGGEIYLGDGGIDCYRVNCGTGTKNASAGIKLGGVKLHATADFGVAATQMDGTFLTTEINGTGGATVIDTDAYTVTWNRKVEGAGTLVKEGAGNLVFTGTNAFTGTLVVNAGVVSFTGDGTNDMSVAKVVLTGAESLALGEGQTLTTPLLVVNGEAKAVGSYDFGDGQVTVVASGANYFIGASGSKWSVGANWSSGAKPAAGSAVDFANLADAFEIELDEDVSFGNLNYAGHGEAPSLTFTGAGKAIFPASAAITVTAGQAVSFDCDVVVGSAGNASDTLVMVTGGTVNFKDVANAEGTADLTSKYAIKANGTGGLGFAGVVSGVSVTASATSTSAKATDLDIVKVTVSGGAEVPFGTAPFVNLVDVVQNGGTVTFAKDATVSNGARVRWYLNGGTLDTGDATLKVADAKSPFELYANGGTVKCSPTAEKSPFDLRTHVTLDGPLAFEQGAAGQSVRLANAFAGEGTLEQKGLGTLVVDTTVESLDLKVSGGTLKVTEVAAAAIPAAAKVTFAPGTTLTLDYDGTVAVKALYKGGRQMRKGVYGEEVAPTVRKAPIVGSGLLNVLEGDPVGLIIVIR